MEEAQSVFDQLKQALFEAPILALTNSQFPFTVETNAFGIGMGVVLSQQSHPIAFFSKSFSSELLQVSTYIQELFAITTTVKSGDCIYSTITLLFLLITGV